MIDFAPSFYVYMLFRLNGMPCYVGKGKGDRWKRHQGRTKNSNRHLGSIIDQARAIGKELPRIKVCENMTEDAAFELERLLIGCIGRSEDGPLVNLTDGGDGPSGYKPDPCAVERRAAKLWGTTQSAESNALRSAALKGKAKSPDHIAAAGAGQRGKTKSFGWWSTEEGRAKQRQNNRGNTGRKHTDETRAVIRAKRALQTNVSTIATQFKTGNTAAKKRVVHSDNPSQGE